MAAITKNRNFLGPYVKLSSAVATILVGVLKCRTQFWKRTTQESFHHFPETTKNYQNLIKMITMKINGTIS
jgi:hypothetical protein